MAASPDIRSIVALAWEIASGATRSSTSIAAGAGAPLGPPPELTGTLRTPSRVIPSNLRRIGDEVEPSIQQRQPEDAVDGLRPLDDRDPPSVATRAPVRGEDHPQAGRVHEAEL